MNRYSVTLVVLCLIIFASSCKDEVLPKPKAMLRLEYPAPEYKEVEFDCPYVFEKNQSASVGSAKHRKQCWYNLEYSKLKATLYLSYFEVDKNLDSLLRDAQNLTQEHVVKADNITQEPYVDVENKVYGMYYEISGNAASQSQFYITDSLNHFLTGSIYFKVRPNYDSILPAAKYLRNDIKHVMETLKWKK